jgi:hypothetical protein
MKTSLLAVVLAASLGALVACGSAKQRAASPQTMPESSAAGGAPADMPGSTGHSEIEKLSAQIDTQRAELGLAEPPTAPMSSGTAPATPMSTIPLSTDASCKPAKTERCDGSCKISDSICTNASRICELAGELADGWSATKCARAKQTCDGAHDSCCSCH